MIRMIGRELRNLCLQLLAALIVVCCLSANMASAQDADGAPGAQVPRQLTVSDSDSIRFYTFIEEDDVSLPHSALMKRLFGEGGPGVRGVRPMVQWMVWANKPKPFLASWLFICFFSVVLWSAAPQWMRNAQTPVRGRFWSTFFIGVLVVAVAATIARVSIRSLIGWPLGIVTLGGMQLFLMGGLSVVSSILGERMAALVKLGSWPVIGKRDSVRRFAELLIGSCICALLLQVPAISVLPRLGTRLVSLLAILGLGGLYRVRAERAGG